MDEIDAALDFKNVSIVAHYIKVITAHINLITANIKAITAHILVYYRGRGIFRSLITKS